LTWESAKIQQRQPPVERLYIEGIVTDDMAPGIPEIFQHSVRLSHHSRFTIADQTGVRFHDQVGDIAPGSAQRQGVPSTRVRKSVIFMLSLSP